MEKTTMDIHQKQSVYNNNIKTEGEKALEPERLKRSRNSDEEEEEMNEELIAPGSEEGTPKESAKDKLHLICVLNKWKALIFECCKEEGPSHLKMFTFKVTVETAEDSNYSNRLLEVYGFPQQKKKAAAESAAEGAIWHLTSLGHIPNKKWRTQKDGSQS